MRPILVAATLLASTLAHPLAHGAEPDVIEREQALTDSPLAAELDGFTQAMAAGIEEALWHVERNGKALHPSLGARLLTTPESIHEQRLADGTLRDQLEARLRIEHRDQLARWYASELAARINDAARGADASSAEPAAPTSRDRLRDDPAFAPQLEAIREKDGSIDFDVVQQRASMMATAVVRFVVENGSAGLDLRRLDQATARMERRIETQQRSRQRLAPADAYQGLDETEMERYLEHLDSAAHERLTSAHLLYLRELESETLTALARHLQGAGY